MSIRYKIDKNHRFGKRMFSEYFQFKDWADKRTIDAAEKLNKDTAQYGFVKQQLNHMVIVEELFQARLAGQPDPHGNTNTATLPSLSLLCQRKVALNQWYINYVAEINDSQLHKEIRFVFKDGKSGMMRVSEILFHIITHGSYHRGNIARALDLANVPHPVDGYGIYIHQVEPQRREG